MKDMILESLLQAAFKEYLYKEVPKFKKPYREEEKNVEIQENGGHMNLDITKCFGETRTNLSKTIAKYVVRLNQNKSQCLGFPVNQEIDYDALIPLLHYHLNNAGDPFLGSGYGQNSVEFEVCVLDWFSKLWKMEKGEYWGYVTTGGTIAHVVVMQHVTIEMLDSFVDELVNKRYVWYQD